MFKIGDIINCNLLYDVECDCLRRTPKTNSIWTVCREVCIEGRIMVVGKHLGKTQPNSSYYVTFEKSGYKDHLWIDEEDIDKLSIRDKIIEKLLK